MNFYHYVGFILILIIFIKTIKYSIKENMTLIRYNKYKKKNPKQFNKSRIVLGKKDRDACEWKLYNLKEDDVTKCKDGVDDYNNIKTTLVNNCAKYTKNKDIKNCLKRNSGRPFTLEFKRKKNEPIDYSGRDFLGIFDYLDGKKRDPNKYRQTLYTTTFPNQNPYGCYMNGKNTGSQKACVKCIQNGSNLYKFNYNDDYKPTMKSCYNNTYDDIDELRKECFPKQYTIDVETCIKNVDELNNQCDESCKAKNCNYYNKNSIDSKTFYSSNMWKDFCNDTNKEGKTNDNINNVQRKSSSKSTSKSKRLKRNKR